MSRTIYLNIQDTGTSVKVVENGKTIIEATPRESRALQLDEAAGKIRVLAHPNEAVLNNFDMYFNEINDKLGTSNIKEFYDKLIELRAFKVGGGGDKHIKDYPANSTDLEDRNFYYKDNYTTDDLPEGLYASISDINKNRVIQDLGLGIVQSGNNIFTVICSRADTFLIQSENVTEDSIIINLDKKVKGKTISLLANPQDKTLILDEIPQQQLSDLKQNEWNVIYIQYLGNFQKNLLGLGSSGTINIYNIQIKQPIIVEQ